MKSQGRGFPRFKKKMRSFVFPAMLNCGKHTGKKQLSERVHNCQYCGHREQRDIASVKVTRKRGLIAVGHTVSENACEVPLIGSNVLAGFEQLALFELVKCD